MNHNGLTHEEIIFEKIILSISKYLIKQSDFFVVHPVISNNSFLEWRGEKHDRKQKEKERGKRKSYRNNLKIGRSKYIYLNILNLYLIILNFLKVWNLGSKVGVKQM